MTIQLRLDTPALNALFPEGSDARVELQHAVIQNFVQRALKPAVVSQEVRDLITKERREAVAQVLKELGLGTSWYAVGSSSLTGTAKEMIRDAATKDIRGQVDEVIAQARNELLGAIPGNLKASVELRTNLELDKLIRERLAEVSKAIFSK